MCIIYITSLDDTTDVDCHVVNVVWMPERKKWAMIDTDKGIYVTNQQDLPLSLEEMRWNKINEVPMQYCSLKGEDINIATIHIICLRTYIGLFAGKPPDTM